MKAVCDAFYLARKRVFMKAKLHNFRKMSLRFPAVYFEKSCYKTSTAYTVRRFSDVCLVFIFTILTYTKIYLHFCILMFLVIKRLQIYLIFLDATSDDTDKDSHYQPGELFVLFFANLILFHLNFIAHIFYLLTVQF